MFISGQWLSVPSSVSCHCGMYLGAGTIDVYLTAGTTTSSFALIFWPLLHTNESPNSRKLTIRLEVLHVDHPRFLLLSLYGSSFTILACLWILRRRIII
ncbi:hypothetical protein ARMSODRAFT_80427 [Armillaria solidipes]|uniref:Uncharacterized protein n=1 Tax=Armillaria solidipes TaxID=1076256 RepID=A0A2H3AMQ9_9AGAR|nr:hypothetical protein ARMSODRAFT_80427 [Armillaria solidipes]